MAETSIPVDKDLRPRFCDNFHCIMGACRYNCCDDGWKIEFNRNDYLAVKHASKSPEMEELMRKCMRRLRGRAHDNAYAAFQVTEDGRCAFHTPEGLCRLQLECGEKILPKVCRVFPRTELNMPSGYLERSMSPACEGVLALLWDLPEGIDFCSDPLPREQHVNLILDKDNPLPLWFSVVREWCVDILQNRRFTLPQRIFLMGLGLKELADGETDIQRWMERAATLPDSVDLADIPPAGDSELAMYLSSCLHTLLKITPRDVNRWRIRNELMGGLRLEPHRGANIFTVSLAPYRAAQARYEERFAGQEHFMENLMVSVFFHAHMPHTKSREALWKSYVNFCNLYAFYRFLSVMSCREGAAGDRDELFRLVVFASRSLIHNRSRREQLRDDFFKNESATLAHMAILLCG